MKKVTFGGKRPSVSPAVNADQWVENREAMQPELKPQEDKKRLTIDVPISLHTRVKSRCAIDNLIMADVIRELLEQHFPPETNHRAGS
jgi:hypothetical protein